MSKSEKKKHAESVKWLVWNNTWGDLDSAMLLILLPMTSCKLDSSRCTNERGKYGLEWWWAELTTLVWKRFEKPFKPTTETDKTRRLVQYPNVSFSHLLRSNFWMYSQLLLTCQFQEVFYEMMGFGCLAAFLSTFKYALGNELVRLNVSAINVSCEIQSNSFCWDSSTKINISPNLLLTIYQM